MAEGPGQFEIQLGHLCNNRCVFCVSGQLTSRGEAPLLDEAELCRSLDAAWAAGHRRVTLLGGEPTIQPGFLPVVRHAVALGFDIVIFSNGSKPGRTRLVDDVAATGGRFEWRFSFQGATEEAHERTTRRKGSFAQLLRSVARASSHGHRVTVNMCVVRQNHASVDRFPELLVPRGVAQLHLDMLNPYDTGTLSADEISAILPRYGDLVPALERMIARFPPGFDVNIGNLPYCVAPRLAPWIHHGGEPTWTVTANDRGVAELGAARKKYALKQAFKVKPDRCSTCTFTRRCSGVFEAYAERFGLDELVPVPPERLGAPDLGHHFFALRTSGLLERALHRVELPPPFARLRVRERGPHRVELAFGADAGEGLVLAIRPPSGGAFGVEGFDVAIASRTVDDGTALAALAWLWQRLVAAGLAPRHPPGPDAIANLPPRVAELLADARLRAPFGDLVWRSVDPLPGGVSLVFESPRAEVVTAWLRERGGRLAAGYRVVPEGVAPSAALVDGLRRLLVALGRLPEEAAAPVADRAPG